MDTPRVTNAPAQPGQRHHTATCTYTGTSTHRSPEKARAHAECPNLHPRPHYSQDPASYARTRSPRPSAIPHSPLLRLRLHNLHDHNHLIRHNHHILVKDPTPQAARKPPKRAPEPLPTTSNPATAKAHAPTKPAPAARPKPKTAAKQPPGPVGAPRPQPAAKPKPKAKPGSASPTLRGRPLPHSAPAIRGPEAAAPSTAPPNRHRRRRHNLHGGARCGRSATHCVPPPLKARTSGPRTTPDQTRTAPGSTSSVPAPLPTLDVSPRTANAPLPPPPRVPTQP